MVGVLAVPLLVFLKSYCCTNCNQWLEVTENQDWNACRKLSIQQEAWLTLNRRGFIWGERRTRCYTIVYWTYDSLNMFLALLCSSSGAGVYADIHSMWHITLVMAGCRCGMWLEVIFPGRWMLLNKLQRTNSVFIQHTPHEAQ